MSKLKYMHYLFIYIFISIPSTCSHMSDIRKQLWATL